MKLLFRQKMAKIASSLVMLVTMCAIANVNSTCMFMAYQPDVPEELM